MPGLVGEWAGVTVDDYTLVGRDTADMTVDWDGAEFPAPVFNEVLRPADDSVEVLARFTQDYYAGSPALTRRRVGAGVVYYLGACFSEELADRLLEACGVRTPLSDVVEAPSTVELAVRGGDDGRYLFLLNYPAVEARVDLLRPVVDLFTGETVSGEVVLPPYGALVARL
jgi:beta-galactosidase